MIQLEPQEPDNYFTLAKIYEDAGAYENAEEILLKAKETKPNDPAVYMTLAGYYNRQGQIRKDHQAARGTGRTTSRRTPKRTTPSARSTGTRCSATPR